MKRLLIIEDSQPMINLLMKKFLSEGFDCEFIYQSGDLSREDIANRIIEYSPDLLFLDLNMPGAGGIAVLEELKFREKENKLTAIPVFILTALKADENEIEYLKKNALVIEYINKPISDIDALIGKTKEFLKN